MSDRITRRIAVIDGNSLMHRAFHAVPDTMNMKDGTPTNAAFGFLSMFFKFLEMEQPDGVVCAFDAGKPAIRMQALEQYKAQRPPMDENLKVQFPVIEGLLTAMNVPVVKLKGWEGDDILGTVAAQCEKRGWASLLVTGDKDAYQLVTDLCRVVTTKKGITDVVVYGPAEVFERYGVTPAQFIDFLGLKGDSADNIPGVPGIGDKTAAKLLGKYGSIEGIYQHIDELKGKQKENLVNNRESAYLSRDVATIITDLELDLDLDQVSFPDFDADAVRKAFEEVGFRSHLAKALSFAQGASSFQSLDIPADRMLFGLSGIDAAKRAVAAGKRVSVAWDDTQEGTLFDSGLRLAVAMGDEGVAYAEGNDALDLAAYLIREGNLVLSDAKAFMHLAYPCDTSLEAQVSDEDILGMRFFDVSLAGYVLDSSVPSDVDSLCQRHLGCSLPASEDDEAKGLCVRAKALELLAVELEHQLEGDGTADIYAQVDSPLLAVLAMMERTGAALDVQYLHELGADATASMDEVRQEIYAKAGEAFNVDSPKQVGHILYEVLGLPATKKTTRGYSTDASVLQELAKVNEVPALILRYRELAKINSTYIEALPRLRAGDDRVHTSFNAMVTTTGRLSSSEPNLQNIPVRTDFGREIRKSFVPLNEGEVFLSADYSQIELRILAHLSGDEHLISAFCNGADFHAQTASRVFDVPVEQVTKEMRSRAKAVNFGIVYGQQAFGLSQSLGISFGEAKDMIDRYFAVYPDVRFFLDETVERARRDGFASTLFGRKRHIVELKARNVHQRGFGERTAMNHPMQGTAADIIKMAMVEVARRLKEQGSGASLILQVHDELDFSVPVAEVREVSALVEDVMSNIVSLKVPLVVDVSHGVNWATAH